MTAPTYTLIGSNQDRIDFNNVDFMILVDGLSGFAGYPVDYEVTSPPGYVGEVINSATVNRRDISLSVVVLGSGRERLEANRLRLINALNPLNGTCKLIWHAEDNNDYYLTLTPDAGCPDFSIGTSHDATKWPCTLRMIAHNPCWQSEYNTSIEIIGDKNRFVLPFDPGRYPIADDEAYTDIYNRGTMPTPVVISLSGALGSPIVLTNDTTGETITVRQDIGGDEILIIDTSDDNLGVTLVDKNTGVRTDALHRCAIGSKFWQLAPGNNRITYSVGSKGPDPRGMLSYRPRWLSR